MSQQDKRSMGKFKFVTPFTSEYIWTNQNTQTMKKGTKNHHNRKKKGDKDLKRGRHFFIIIRTLPLSLRVKKV